MLIGRGCRRRFGRGNRRGFRRSGFRRFFVGQRKGTGRGIAVTRFGAESAGTAAVVGTIRDLVGDVPVFIPPFAVVGGIVVLVVVVVVVERSLADDGTDKRHVGIVFVEPGVDVRRTVKVFRIGVRKIDRRGNRAAAEIAVGQSPARKDKTGTGKTESVTRGGAVASVAVARIADKNAMPGPKRNGRGGKSQRRKCDDGYADQPKITLFHHISLFLKAVYARYLTYFILFRLLIKRPGGVSSQCKFKTSNEIARGIFWQFACFPKIGVEFADHDGRGK